MRPRRVAAEFGLSAAQRGYGRRRFNEAAASRRGIPYPAAHTWYAQVGFNEAAASRRGILCRVRTCATLAIRFNEAAASRRGIPKTHPCPGFRSLASMRPRRVAAEFDGSAGDVVAGERSFNEAAASRRGIPARRSYSCTSRASMRPRRVAAEFGSEDAAYCRSVVVASMRPRRVAAEFPQAWPIKDRRCQASMRPRRVAAEFAARWPATRVSRFNEAAASRRGILARLCAGARVIGLQ